MRICLKLFRFTNSRRDMKRKFFYSLLTLISFLAAYQLCLHVHGSKLKVNNQLLQTRHVEERPEVDKLRGRNIVKDKHEGTRAMPVSVSAHASRNGELKMDEVPQPTKSLIVENSRRSGNTKYYIPSNSVTIRAQGRLGNHMFQYASMLGIAYKNNLTAIITGESKVADTFNVDTQIYSHLKFSNSHIEYEEKKGCVFEPEALQLGSKSDIFLKGYFQSWKYFDFFEKGLRKQFQWNKAVSAASKHRFESLIPLKQRTYVGVHVRRGDFIFNTNFRKYGYVAANTEYISRAMNYFRTKMKNAFFIVASDDYSWCKFNIKGDDVRFAEETAPAVDMAILTLCNHTIMTVGSFGWWAAWLTGGETVYFKDFPRPGSKLDALFKADDYWPPSWIPM